MTIAEISKKYDITADTLRYYERIGLIPTVNRSIGGIRNYNEIDCGWVEFVKCMRSSGIPIEVLIKYVDLFQQGNDTIEARKKLLVEQRNQLASKINELQNTLDKLNFKIENYEQKIVPLQNKLTKN